MTKKTFLFLSTMLGLWAVGGLLFLLQAQAAPASAAPEGSAAGGVRAAIPVSRLPQGLVHYWRFDEGSGTVAADAVNGNNGSLFGNPAWIPGVSGKAIFFDGVDDEIYIPQSFPSTLPLHQNGNFSLLFWIKRVDTRHRTIFWTRGDSTDANRFHINTMDGSGSLGMDYRAPDGTIHGIGSASFSLPANQWTHVAIVRSGNTYLRYRNGHLVDQWVDSAPALPTYSGPWYIARAASSSSAHAYFLGALDEVAIFNVALSAEQIQEYYNSSANGQGYVPIDDFNDNRLNPALWQASIEGSGPLVAETNQRLEITLPATSHETGAGVFKGRITSVCKVQGDFDMMVNYELLNWPSNNGVRLGLGAIGTVERVSRANSEPPAGEYYAANFGGSSTITSTAHTSGTLRMTRSGDTLAVYYRTPDGQWMQIASEPGHTTQNVYFDLALWSHDAFFANQIVKAAFDDFTLAQGRLLCVQMSSGASKSASLAATPLTYVHTLTNTGTFTDTFVVTHSSTQNWPTGYKTPITLGAGQSVTFTVTITPPVGTISGTVETTTITVTSQTDADIAAALTDRTTLQTRYQYMPIVTKNP